MTDNLNMQQYLHTQGTAQYMVTVDTAIGYHDADWGTVPKRAMHNSHCSTHCFQKRRLTEAN